MLKKLKSVLILAIGLGLAYWFVSRLDWPIVGKHLQSVHIWPLILGAILINLTMLARALRWQAFLMPIRRVKVGNLFAATVVGFGSIFIIGRAGGELIRPAVLSLRERLRPSATLATVLIERIYDMSTVIMLFAINLLFFRLPSEREHDLQKFGGMQMIGLVLLCGLILGLAILVFLGLKAAPIIRWLEGQSGRLPQKLMNLLLNFVKHLADGLSVLLNLRELAVTLLYTLWVWGFVAAATWLTLYGFGLTFSLGQVIFVLGFGLAGSVIPTPGGSAGAFHAAAAKGLEFLGIEHNLAASIALVYHLIAFGPPFLLGLYYLVRDEISFGQLREMIASEGETNNLLENKA